MTREDEDSILIQRCLEGDSGNFRPIVEKYQGRLYRVIYGVVLDREAARDLAQEAFIKAYRSLHRFKGGSRFYTWLYRIAFNLALDFRKKKFKEFSVEYEDDWKQETAASFPNQRSERPDRRLMRAELYDKILEGLETLTPLQRTAILLREWEGCSYREISRIMNSSKGTVMSRLHYARDKLRKHLEKYLEEK